MRLSLRFILPLIVVLACVAYAITSLTDSLLFNKWFLRDVEIRSKLIGSTLEESIIEILENPSSSKMQKLFERAIQDERLYALAICDKSGSIKYQTHTFPKTINCPYNVSGTIPSQVIQLPQGSLHVAYYPLSQDNHFYGQLMLIHDMSILQKRSADTKMYIFYLFTVLTIIISVITVVIAQLSWRGWVKGLRSLLSGQGLFKPVLQQTPSAELRPVVNDLRALIRDLENDRHLRNEEQLSWNSKTLKDILKRELAGDEVLVVSNREPYIHVRRNNKIEIQFPASGLVTALEPVMRACSGTWVAHGSGSADKEVVDKLDHIQVPPENPSYRIRRIWLSKEEENGYYYGFANEGIWALCHIAHVRPIFRSSDWAMYVAANEKFAKAVIEEAKTDDPVVLVQDYHLALVPKLIREALPKATVITFWHIPFPNPEVFGICPWRREILEGLLGSSILGFHTHFHCNNFLDSVDRFIESRVDRETSTISFHGEVTAVNRYPISIEYPVKWLDQQKSVPECRRLIREANGLPQNRKVGLGVDRLDYTKGILERLNAVERLLELNPKWIGNFSFIQIAAPSRTAIPQYQQFQKDVVELASKINARFSQPGYVPVILKIEHCGPEEIYQYYRGCDLCFVSSLHDGMNLVAKEFVASRDDEHGVLILSQFTGASRELLEALIVNPYNIDQCATALLLALEMPEDEQRTRMRTMRGLIKEFNVYRWAGRMLLDAARLRQRRRLLSRAKTPSEALSLS